MGSALAVSVPVLFCSPEGLLTAHGPQLRRGVPARALPAHLATLRAEGAGAELAFAAVPFDLGGIAWVTRPERVVTEPAGRASSTTDRPVGHCARRAAHEPDRHSYMTAVEEAIGRIRRSAVVDGRKVVLARRIGFEFAEPIDLERLLARLRRDAHATTFCLPLEPDAPGRVLIGASPELLVAKTGASVTSAPLAGSAARSDDRTHDRDVAAALQASAKDRREHALVVEWIADRLAPYCRTLDVPVAPSVVSTDTMWHLATHITGVLRDETVPSAELALALHPTPAVAGLPLEFAQAAIADLEPFDRRYYAGIVGWSDRRGDGRWMVAIRCAEIEGATAHVYAGAGILDGSVPEAEADETSAKFRTFLTALGVDEDGRTLTES